MAGLRPRVSALVALACALIAGPLDADETKPASAAAVSFAASVARVRLEVSRQNVAVVHDINLARGSFRGADAEVFVAFGAPGAPRALDARLVTVPKGALESSPRDRGVPLVWRYAPRRPVDVTPLVGRGTMAGVAIQLPGELVDGAMKVGNMVTLRLRALYAVPGATTTEQQATARERDVVVRLGETTTGPLVLGRIEVAATDDPIVLAEAKTCGDGATGAALALRIVGPGTAARHEAGEAPVLAPRIAREDLCVRIVTAAK